MLRCPVGHQNFGANTIPLVGYLQNKTGTPGLAALVGKDVFHLRETANQDLPRMGR